MRGETLEAAWPVYQPSKPGTRTSHLSDEDARHGNEAIVGFLTVLLYLFSVRRYFRRWAIYDQRQAYRAYDAADDAPPSTDIAPLPLRADGPAGEVVILGDDDEQFRFLARPGLSLALEDGRRCTFAAGTPLKCTFPGFTLVRDSRGKASVGVPAGTTFFVVADLPTEEARHPVNEDAHPFREAAAMPAPLELVPIQARYECRLDPAPVRRKRLAKILPKTDTTKKPRYRGHLYPGIPLAILWVFAIWGNPTWTMGIVILSCMILAGVEDGVWALASEDI